MSHSKFGWSYPPGCDGPPDSGDETCAVCGVDAGSCECPVCPVCGVQGDPACYTEHGLKHPANASNDQPLHFTEDDVKRASGD